MQPAQPAMTGLLSSHHLTSHHITSHHITSHHITSHHITSHHITSHHITSHHITSHHIWCQLRCDCFPTPGVGCQWYRRSWQTWTIKPVTFALTYTWTQRTRRQKHGSLEDGKWEGACYLWKWAWSHSNTMRMKKHFLHNLGMCSQPTYAQPWCQTLQAWDVRY